ncbi:hypothetical protein THRCLA_01639 [Thraustotheca clavata]|uniref:Uncharacterized protein n=1 Tax=Thraustotheca clavata TaxID=74557 RepID=A0A1W0A8I6_9STRA|nr:hypothetical protein THRCLA_01639 [Thraustotheca clavata]
MSKSIAFKNKDYRNIQAFIRLIGIIAIENAHFVAHQYPHMTAAQLVDEEDSNDEHYMDDYETEQQQKRAIRSERERILNEGILGAFLPFLESFLPQDATNPTYTPPIELVLTALASLGDFMSMIYLEL